MAAALTMNQIAGLILNMDDTSGPIMVAIAMAESAGIPDRVGGPNANGSYDYGLWQINGRAHPNLMDSYDWKDPDENWAMAYIVYSDAGKSFRPWSSYNNGTYRTYLLQAQQAWRNPDKSTSLEDRTVQTTDAGEAVAGLSSFIGNLSNPETWMRIGLVVGGSIALLVALWLLAAE